MFVTDNLYTAGSTAYASSISLDEVQSRGWELSTVFPPVEKRGTCAAQLEAPHLFLVPVAAIWSQTKWVFVKFSWKTKHMKRMIHETATSPFILFSQPCAVQQKHEPPVHVKI